MALVSRSQLLPAVVLLASFALGALLCVMKGEEGGLAMAVGNLSAPYVIVAVGAGLTARSWWRASLLGVAATELTVAGFYVTWAEYFGHEVSQTSVVLSGGAGVFSGALFGAIGWAARSRRGLRYVVPALLLLEPAVTEAASPLLARIGIGYGWRLINLASLPAYLIEITLGAVVFVLVLRHVRAGLRREPGPATA